MQPYLIFPIAGGIGKNILATAVIESIKKSYPEHRVVVLTAYMDVFVNNPNVYRVLQIDNLLYFKEDYMKEDTVYLKQEPYNSSSFIKKENHLIESWCEAIGVECITKKPNLYLTKVEIEFAQQKFKRDKPLFIIQPSGGSGNSYSWARDIPHNQAQAVVNEMSKTHHIIHIRTDEQPALQNVEVVTAPMRELFALIRISDKRLLIDSFAEHCAAAFELPSVVCWIKNKPKVYSYDCHTNILPKHDEKFTHGITKGLDEDWMGTKLYECPYNVSDMFDVTEILEKL